MHILLYLPPAVQLDLLYVTLAALTCKPLHNAPELLRLCCLCTALSTPVFAELSARCVVLAALMPFRHHENEYVCTKSSSVLHIAGIAAEQEY